jgi:hypothetical protein
VHREIVSVKENSPVSDTTPRSNSKINGECVVQSDYKIPVPSMKENSPFSVAPKSKGVVDEEVQFFMSQIDLSSERESWTRKRKTEISTFELQTPQKFSPQRSKFLFETLIQSSNIKKHMAKIKEGHENVETPGRLLDSY